LTGATIRGTRTRPDMVVMDTQLGRESGLEADRQIRATNPRIVVVLSAYRDPTWVVRATQAGASAFANTSTRPGARHDVDRSRARRPHLTGQSVSASPIAAC
jgi:DNA-binding NarL/FixJ family response regulator